MVIVVDLNSQIIFEASNIYIEILYQSGFWH